MNKAAAAIGAALLLVIGAPLAIILGVFASGPGSSAGASVLAGRSSLDFAEAFAQEIGAENEPAVMFVVAWEQAEGASQSANNPLDSTLAETGSTPLPGNSAGAQMYPTLGTGLIADVATIQGNAVYASVVADLVAGNVGVGGADLQASPWCRTPQGQPCPGYGAAVVALVGQYSTNASAWQLASSVVVGTTPLDMGGQLPVESGNLSAMWSFLQAQLGKPYQWAGAGPDSWDCSGLVMVAYAQVGVPLEHNAAAQYAETDKAALPLGGTANLEPGDLLFWAYDTSDPSTIHHVAIYVGDGEVVDAPHTGTVVQVQPWWPDGFYGATRPWRSTSHRRRPRRSQQRQEGPSRDQCKAGPF